MTMGGCRCRMTGGGSAEGQGVGAQNDKRGNAVILRCGSPSLSVILRSGLPSLSVILRSAATKNLSYHVSEPGEKILRFAQNDNGGWGAE